MWASVSQQREEACPLAGGGASEKGPDDFMATGYDAVQWQPTGIWKCSTLENTSEHNHVNFSSGQTVPNQNGGEMMRPCLHTTVSYTLHVEIWISVNSKVTALLICRWRWFIVSNEHEINICPYFPSSFEFPALIVLIINSFLTFKRFHQVNLWLTACSQLAQRYRLTRLIRFVAKGFWKHS